MTKPGESIEPTRYGKSSKAGDATKAYYGGLASIPGVAYKVLESTPLAQMARAYSTDDTWERLDAQQQALNQRLGLGSGEQPQSTLDALGSRNLYQDTLADLDGQHQTLMQTAQTPQTPAPTQTTADVTGPVEAGTLLTERRAEEAQSRILAAALTGDQEMYNKYVGQLREARNVSDAGFKAEATALQARSTLELNKGLMLATAQENRADELARERRDIATAEKLRTDALNTVKGQIDLAEQAVSNFEIDPKRMFPTTAHAFGSALAMALGSFGSSLTGGENTAFKILDRAVARDIDAQKAELGKLQYMVGRKDSQYSKLLSEHGTERQAEALMRVQADKLFELEINRLEKMYGGMINQQAVAAMRAQLEQRRGGNIANLAGHEFNAGMKKYALNLQEQANAARAEALKVANALKGFKDADTRTKMSAQIAAKDQLDMAVKSLDMEGKNINSFKGALTKYLPYYTDDDAYKEEMKKLALSLITMQSGASFTDRSYDEILGGLPQHSDTRETKLDKLFKVKNMLSSKTLGNYQVLSPQEKQYYHSVFNGPPSRLDVASRSAAGLSLGRGQTSSTPRTPGAVGPDQ